MGTLNRKIARRYGKAIDLNNFKADGSLETGAPTIYDSAGLLPTSGVAVGTQAYVTANQKLYIRATGGWYNVATVNTTPTISSVADASSNTSPFDLAKDGSTTTVITITATDSEGFPLTFSAVANSGFNGLATVAQDSSVFTITPKSADSATTTEGTLTFRASDGVNIASEIATFTLTFKVADSRFTSTLIKAIGSNGVNTTINDASSSNHTITVQGSAVAQAHTPYHPGGYSAEFNGSNSQLTAAHSSDFNIYGSTDGFTIEGWIYPRSYHTNNYGDGIICKNSGSTGWIVRLGTSSSPRLQFVHPGTAGTGPIGDDISLNQWTHFAFTRATNGNFKLYQNGRLTESFTLSGNNQDTNQTLYIGYESSQSSSRFDGYIKDVRISNTIVYTADFTAPTSSLTSTSNTKFLACHLPYFADGSSSSHTVTPSNVSNERFSPHDFAAYGAASDGASVYFDGSDWLETPNSSDFTFGTGDFTVEGWYYQTSIGPNNSYNYLFGMGASTGAGFGVYQQGNVLKVYIHGTTVITGSEPFKYNTWHHVALTREGTNLRLFLNGVLDATATNSTSISVGTNKGISIARWAEVGDGGYMIGKVSDFRVIKGTAAYTSTFTPPTAPLTAITNTKLLTCNDTPNIYDANGSKAEVVLVGDAKSSTAQTKYASASMYFDGTGDAVRVGSTGGTQDSYDLDQFAFSQEPLSIEFWMRPSIVTKQTVVSFIKYNGNGGRNTPHFYFENDGTLKYWRNASIIASTTALSTNTWYHISYNRFGGRDAFYLNGTVVGNSTIGQTSYEQGRMSLGQYYTTVNALYHTQPFNGYLEDIRVTKGKIRNVMPTAETFTSDSNTTFLTAHASTIVDGSSNNHTITTSGSPTVYDFGPAPGMKSIYFNGTTDYLSMGTGLFANTDFTIELWWYPPDDGDSWTASDISGVGSHTFIDSRGGVRLQLWQLFSSSSSAVANSTGGYTASYYGTLNSLYWHQVRRRWTHYAYQRTNGTLRCYVNGIDQGWSVSVTGNPTNNTTYIGARHDNQKTRLKGYISNYRISNVARYTGNFTPTTAELTG